MRLGIAGGVGDEGRSCFFVSGRQHSYIVDCGTSTDGLDRVPDLTAEEIRSAEFVFLTHSHRDHTGALEYLEEMGSTATVLMSAQTYRQVHYKPKNATILDSTAPEVELLPDLSVRWGRSGHCCGSVWYAITCEGKTAFFSGDYREGDPFYRNDPVRDLTANVAVIDAAYPTDDLAGAMRSRFLEKAEAMLSGSGSLLLPVPHFGRGLSMAALLWQIFKNRYPIGMSPKLFREWTRFARRSYFVNPEVFEIPLDAFSEWDETEITPGGIYFLTDAQLGKASSRELLDRNPSLSVLLTGHVHGYGRAKGILETGRASQVIWPNHQTAREAAGLAAANHFEKVIFFHDPSRAAEESVIEF